MQEAGKAPGIAKPGSQIAQEGLGSRADATRLTSVGIRPLRGQCHRPPPGERRNVTQRGWDTPSGTDPEQGSPVGAGTAPPYSTRPQPRTNRRRSRCHRSRDRSRCPRAGSLRAASPAFAAAARFRAQRGARGPSESPVGSGEMASVASSMSDCGRHEAARDSLPLRAGRSADFGAGRLRRRR